MLIDEKALDEAMKHLCVQSAEGKSTYRLVVEAYEAAKTKEQPVQLPHVALKEDARHLAAEIINSLPAGMTFCTADYEEAEGYAFDALKDAYKAGAMKRESGSGDLASELRQKMINLQAAKIMELKAALKFYARHEHWMGADLRRDLVAMQGDGEQHGWRVAEDALTKTTSIEGQS